MRVTDIQIPKMDCPSEELMLRNAFADAGVVIRLDFDIPNRRVRVTHEGSADLVVARAATVGLGAVLIRSEASSAAVHTEPADEETRILRWAFAINAVTFVVELAAGLIGHSAGLVSDSLDMFADATVYALSLYAVGRASQLKLRAAHFSGWLQMALAMGALLEVVRRFLSPESPDPWTMIGIALLALIANLATLRLLAPGRSGEAHMQASWIFTTRDVLVNMGVILAGVLVYATSSRWPDLVIGTVTALLVASGAARILRLRA